MSPKSTIKLTGPALEVARQIRDAHNKLRENLEKAEQAYQARCEALREEAQHLHQKLMPELIEVAEVDGTQIWSLDARYIDDHNCAFLIRHENGDVATQIKNIIESQHSEHH